MVSSTFTDLKEHRAKVIEAIEKLGFRANVMENSGPQATADVIDTSLKMVRDSSAYIGVISRRYGQAPECPDRNQDQLSITELEFNEAMRLNRPILLFIMGDKHKVTEADIELDPVKRKKLDAFRERAKQMKSGSKVERVYAVFNDLQEFTSEASIAVGQLTRDIGPCATNAGSATPEASAPETISNIPIAVPAHFLGRDDDLAAIDAALKGCNGRVAITALHGLRGVGKTTLAAAYAERRRGEYRATWWVRAETEATTRADLVGLGVQLGWVAADDKEEPALAAVLQRLRDDGEGMLLIYDNAVNSDAIRPYVPRGGGARLIVTSNAPNWRGLAEPVEIEVWPKEIGADFLIARAGRTGERNAALSLSEALGGLPLAHAQAGAYCERTGVSFAEYLKRFNDTPAAVLDAAKDAPPEYHDKLTVTKTFALAIDEAAKLHPAAEPLIVHAALLAPEPIPLFLFSEARAAFGEPFATALAGDGLDEAVAALRALALVDRETLPDERDPSIETDCIRLHRLVREVAAARVAGDDVAVVQGRLVWAMVDVYPDDIFNDPLTWPRARRLDALVLRLVDSAANPPEGMDLLLSHLLDRLASFRQSCLADYGAARVLFERALEIREKMLGFDHPVTALSLNNLGSLLRVQDDLAAAKPYFERALTIWETALGPDHQATATSLDNLGSLLQSQGDLAAAQSYHERALAICERALGPDHPASANNLNNLGNLLHAQGDLVGAQSYHERALAIREKAFGPDHLETANSLHNLGALLKAQDDLVAAKSFHERALTIVENALGPAHPTTKTVATNLALVLIKRGDTDEAKALWQKYGLSDNPAT